MSYVILAFAAIFFISIRPMLKQKQKRDLIWVCLLYLLSLSLCLLVVAGVNLPSPSMAIADIMKNIGLHYPPLD